MGEHITQDGKFRSDKYRVIRMADGADVSDDKLVLSFRDPHARAAISQYVDHAGSSALGSADQIDFIDDVAARLLTFPDT